MTIGLHIMRPTSIAVAGGGTETASIRSDGGVEFANATSLSLNGVFTAAYDNYMVTLRYTASAQNAFGFRLRASGTDASGSNYTYQYVLADNTSVLANRSTTTLAYISGHDTPVRAGLSLYLYGPNLAQPTAMRSVTVRSYASATIDDYANTHSLSTAYDGFTLLPQGGANITGMITAYGYAQ